MSLKCRTRNDLSIAMQNCSTGFAQAGAVSKAAFPLLASILQRSTVPGTRFFGLGRGWSCNGLRRIRGNSELFSSAFADSPERFQSPAVRFDRANHPSRFRGD